MCRKEESHFFAVSSETLTTCRLLERLGVPSGCASQPTHEGMAFSLLIWSATCQDREVTELTKLDFIWLASGARSSDDRQTTNRRMPDGSIVYFSFVSSGVCLAGTNSRRCARSRDEEGVGPCVLPVRGGGGVAVAELAARDVA